jgi:dynein light intermediate chain 1, cytosolic
MPTKKVYTDRHFFSVHIVANWPQTDTLARVSTYLLTSPSSTFDSLLRPLLTPQTIPETLIIVLLDWSQPWSWLRQLRRWILLLRSVLRELSPECTYALEEVMRNWRDRGRGGGAMNLDGSSSTIGGEGAVALPVGPGEWEDGLGLPLCVVCQNVSLLLLYAQDRTRLHAYVSWAVAKDGYTGEDARLEGGRL